MKIVKIHNTTWETLMIIKVKKKLPSIDAVIRWLIEENQKLTQKLEEWQKTYSKITGETQ